MSSPRCKACGNRIDRWDAGHVRVCVKTLTVEGDHASRWFSFCGPCSATVAANTPSEALVRAAVDALANVMPRNPSESHPVALARAPGPST